MAVNVRAPQRVGQPLIEPLEWRRLLSFGLTTTSSSYTVDTGAGVTFTILRGGTVSSTIHLGDMTSLKYNGNELLATYAQTSRYSHYEQGLSSAAVISATVDPNGQWIKITCDDSAASSGGVIQYYVARKNDPNVYMASLPTDVTNGPGEGRYIAYLSRSVFTNIEPYSDISANTGAIEGSDVFGNADGTTASKFYNTRQMINNIYHGVTGTAGGSGVGAYMYMGNREHSAGGPFFKDIDYQTTSAATEIYNCLFTGHTQTETFRQGLQGPYALQVTNGSLPTTPDYSFLEGVGISGLVPASGRGTITGVASGVPVGHNTVVTLTNTSAQYWGTANASTGSYTISGVLPGTYTETIYDQELAVGTRTVTITAAATTKANIADTYYTPSATWRIGTWDGTPGGFLNSDKIATMHPSDVRMSSWTSTLNFVIGTNTDSQWPLVQFMGVNNSQRITFTLTSAQAAQAQTLRIGITLGFAGGRNQVTVNAGQTYAWTSSIPAASTNLNSRGITRGTYRGPNQLYTYSIPTSALKAGTNTIDLPVVSGSYVSGQTWLSPNVTYDAIDLVPTASLTGAPKVTTIAVSPTGSSIGYGAATTFSALVKDQNGATMAANLVWTAARGTIDDAGNYIAPSTTGTDTITATDPTTGVMGTATINVLSPTPSVVTAASGSPSPSFINKTTLTALGSDLTGEANLTYTWSILGTPPGPVTFASVNGTNAGKSTLATFTTPGAYSFRVTITNGQGLSTTSDTSVTVYDKKAWYQADTTNGTTLVDSSGAGTSATLSGSYSYVSGVSGNALKLSGGAAALPSGIVSGFDDFTISAWVKPDSISTWARVFDFGTGTTSYMFLTTRSSSGGIRFAITTSGGSGEQQLNGPALTAGVWTHLAVTLSGNTGTLYVNGVAVATNTLMTIHPTALGTTTQNYLGDSQFTADPALLGSIDDFRLYGRALSATAVAALATPAAPTGVTATPGNAQVSLAWAAAAGASSYSVQRASVTGGPYTTLASGLTALTYNDTTAQNGTTYYYVINAVDAGASASSAEVQATPLGVAPAVASFVVNDGSAQRSMVTLLTVNFTQAVSLSASAITLTQSGTPISFTLSPSSGSASQFVLTFSGSGIIGGSLPDGAYTLTVNGSGVTSAGSAQMTGTSTYTFKRLFGDINGDGSVNSIDNFQFRLAFGTSTGMAGFNWAFDYDGNGVINSIDNFAFRTRFGLTI